MGKFTKIKVDVPDLNRAYVSGQIDFSSVADRAENLAMLNNILRTDGIHLRRWGAVFEIDVEIGASFEAAESGGRNMAPNRFGATGKWQMTAEAISECVPKWKAYQKQPMPSAAVNFMNAKAPFIMTLERDVPLTNSRKAILEGLLKNDPEFNIMAGCMYLRWLLEKFKLGGYSQLNKAMVAYNAGPYNGAINTTKNPIPTENLVNNKAIPLESRKYLLKLLGQFGYMDLMFKEKLA